jgi:hypothetical protein
LHRKQVLRCNECAKKRDFDYIINYIPTDLGGRLMATKDDYRKVARTVKKELDGDKLAFKTYQRDHFAIQLKAIAGPANAGGKDVWDELESAFIQEGLLVFPALDDTEEDGYTRVYRSGTRIAGVLNAIRFPGGGSDEELSALLGKLKQQTFGQDT